MSEADGITTTVSVGKQGQSPRTIHDARCLEARQRLLVGATTDGFLPRRYRCRVARARGGVASRGAAR